MKLTLESEKPHKEVSSSFQILVCGDFLAESDQKPIGATDINHHSFNETLSRLEPRLTLDIPNLLTDEHPRWWLKLKFSKLTDFSPAGLIKNVPELQWIDELRTALKAVTTGTKPPSALNSLLEDYKPIDALAEPLRLCKAALQPTHRKPVTSSPSPTLSSQQDPVVDSILDMVALPDEQQREESRGSSFMSGLIKDIGKNTGSGKIPSEFIQAHRMIGKVIGRQVDEILHHPDFQAHEATWRGMKFLIDRTNFRKPVKIQILSSTSAELPQILENYLNRKVSDGRLPNLIIADYYFDNKIPDLELLKQLATTLASSQTSLIYSIDASFFGQATTDQISRLTLPDGLRNLPGYEKWNSLRDDPTARWLSACFNPLLLRLPYPVDHRNASGLTESIENQGHYLWGKPAWALACAITTSLARTGWPTEFVGPRAGRIDDLPLRVVEEPGLESRQLPLAWPISEMTAKDLSRAGIISLTGGFDQDFAVIRTAPTLHYPAYYSDTESHRISRLMSSLPYQLLAGRIVSTITSQTDNFRASHSVHELQQEMKRSLEELLVDTGPDAKVSVGLEYDKENNPLLEIRLKTGREIMNGTDLQLSLAV
ncbi:MAG: hypothetical protein GY703_13120 [Gammaproteobacteria bacterium]|nr:hypothetical protein [Gammaproteobacteria bacterium]